MNVKHSFSFFIQMILKLVRFSISDFAVDTDFDNFQKRTSVNLPK